MLIFFEHQHISADQEQKILNELETAKVNFVVISNGIVSQEPGRGAFGRTHCKRIAKYLEDNFTIAVQFGDWKSSPGWAWNYGTEVLKRKVFLK